MKAKIIKEFKGVPDNSNDPIVCKVGDTVEGRLADVALQEGWAISLVKEPKKKRNPKGPTYTVIASGPSACKEDARKAKEKTTCIVVNDSYLLLPDADYLYACDGRWWAVHYKKICEIFNGKKYSILLSGKVQPGMEEMDVINLPSQAGGDLGEDCIHHGPMGNSGYQAINLAYMLGAGKIILLGFDMSGTHFFGDHPGELKVKSPFKQFIQNFKTIQKPIEIINCSRQTAVDAFPIKKLEDVLRDI